MIEIGTRSIGHAVANQQGYFWEPVNRLSNPNGVLRNSRRSLKVQIWIGHLKRSSNIPMNGCKRTEKKSMDPMHARGFLAKLLNEGQLKEIRTWENRLPPGRYLQASEICKYYGLKPEPIDDMRMALMDRFYQDWLRLPANNNPKVEKTKQDEVHAFEDYVIHRFVDPIPEAKAGWMNA